MNTNFEHTPPVIFDWLETLEFSQLSESQQKEVLAYFSKEDYNAMHYTAVTLKQASVLKSDTQHTHRKDLLLEKFDRHHAGKKIIPLFSTSVIAWQAASVILFLLCGWLFYKMVDLKKDAGPQQMATLDTVFVNRQVKSEPEIIHDTIYLYKQQTASGAKSNANTGSAFAGNAPDENLPELTGDIYVMPLNESENKAAQGHSMRDDSLLKRYTFVSL